MRRRLLTISQVIEYVFAFIYAVIAAMCFSLGDKLYILFGIFSIISLVIGLYTQTVKYHLSNNTLTKTHETIFLVTTILAVISLPSLVLNLISLKQPDTILPSQFKPDAEHKSNPRISIWVAIISLAVVLIASFVGGLFESNAYHVEIKDGVINKELSDKYIKGQTLTEATKDYVIEDPEVSISYTMYRPKEATATNPLPVVFVVPGFTRTKATMSQYAIELTRRGMVVFIIDPGSQGDTTHGGYQYNSETGEYVLDEQGNKIQNSYSVARSGAGYLVQYVYNNIDDFDFIDRDQIGLVGHSAGGGDACKLAADLAGTSYDTSIIKALYISGYIKTSAANVFKNLTCNAALSYAKYDEGSFRYQDENQAYEIIALRFINEVKLDPYASHRTFETDVDYGDMDNGTYRIIHHEDINHCFEMYDKLSIANTINFFRRTLKSETTLKDTNQVWFGQELSNGIALAAGFTFIIALIGVIVNYVPFMKSLKRAGEERMEEEKQIRKNFKEELQTNPDGTVSIVSVKEKTFLKRVLFYLPMILTAIIACLDYIPLARLSMDLFEDAAGNVYTTYFPARMMNAVFLWAVVNGAIGLVVWAGTTALENLGYTIYANATNTENKADWSKFRGLRVNLLDLAKSLGLAIVLFFVFYGLIAFCHLTTHQDFRFMLISASPLNKRFLVTWLIYLAGFFVFYISNSIRVNLTIAREGYKEWQVLVIAGLANSLGLAFMLLINYWVYFNTGTVFYGYYSATDQSEMWLYINMVFGLVVMMFILPIFNRLAYKKTGNVYFGALLWCMIFIMMSLSASISFIPM